MGQLIRAACQCGFKADDILFDSGEQGYAHNYACYRCKSIFSIVKRRPIRKLSIDSMLRGETPKEEPKEPIICPTCHNEECDNFLYNEYHRHFPEVRSSLFKKRGKVRKWILSIINITSHKLYLRVYRRFDFLLEPDYLSYCPACLKFTCRLYDAGVWD